MELTVVMPCLNEAETVATCVRKAIGFLAESGISGEVLIADNGSTDGSQQLATDAGARVVPISDKGFGNALMGGIIAAHGKYVIMGDADDSYDWGEIPSPADVADRLRERPPDDRLSPAALETLAADGLVELLEGGLVVTPRGRLLVRTVAMVFDRYLREQRDRARANWRFHARPGRWYRMVWREKAREMLGWAVLSVSGETALVADFLGREKDGSDLPSLFSAAAAEAGRLGASRLVFWESPGGPAADLLRSLPGERRDAGVRGEVAVPGLAVGTDRHDRDQRADHRQPPGRHRARARRRRRRHRRAA